VSEVEVLNFDKIKTHVWGCVFVWCWENQTFIYGMYSSLASTVC